MGSLPLVMAATKVNNLCSEGVVVTERIENEFETRKISRELFLIVNGEKVNFQLEKSVPDWEELRYMVKKTINNNLSLHKIRATNKNGYDSSEF